MQTQQLTVDDRPSEDDLEFLEDQINTHNKQRVGAHDYRPLAIFVRGANNAIVAGLSGYTWASFCEIQFLWVHSDVRKQGYGSALLETAEREARQRGCGLVVLASYTFQAPGFYLHHGYSIAGQVDDCPPGQTHYYFKKAL
jgi:GNAT superfamily N-acetyltransferase